MTSENGGNIQQWNVHIVLNLEASEQSISARSSGLRLKIDQCRVNLGSIMATCQEHLLLESENNVSLQISISIFHSINYIEYWYISMGDKHCVVHRLAFIPKCSHTNALCSYEKKVALSYETMRSVNLKLIVLIAYHYLPWHYSHPPTYSSIISICPWQPNDYRCKSTWNFPWSLLPSQAFL